MMKKLIVLAVVLAVGLAISLAYAEAPKSTTTTQPIVATTPVKSAPAVPVAPTPTLESWKCKITAMDAKTLTVENEVTKKTTKLNVGTLNVKDYAVGDKIKVEFEKDLLKSIAKAK